MPTVLPRVNGEIEALDAIIASLNEEKEKSNEELLEAATKLKTTAATLLATQVELNKEHDELEQNETTMSSHHKDVHTGLENISSSLMKAKKTAFTFSEHTNEAVKNAFSEIANTLKDVKATKYMTMPLGLQLNLMDLMLSLMQVESRRNQFGAMSGLGGLGQFGNFGGIRNVNDLTVSPDSSPERSPSPSPSP